MDWKNNRNMITNYSLKDITANREKPRISQLQPIKISKEMQKLLDTSGFLI